MAQSETLILSLFDDVAVKIHVNAKGGDISECMPKEKDLFSKVDELKEMVAQLLTSKQ